MPPRATSKSVAAAKKDKNTLDASNVDAGSRKSARTQRGASTAQNTQDMSTRASKRALESAATEAAADDAQRQDAVSAKKKTVVSSETAENQVTDTQEELQELQPAPVEEDEEVQRATAAGLQAAVVVTPLDNEEL